MQDLKLLSQAELLNHARKLAEEDRRISLLLIECLRECERRMLYAELGFSSLWEFAVRYLGLSEGSAHLRISAMRLGRDNPPVMQSIQCGELSLSNAAQLHSFFQAEKKDGKVYVPEEKKEIINSVIGLSKRECERKLLALSPAAIPQEKERTLSDDKTELRLVLDAFLLEKLQRLKELLSHRLPQASYVDLLSYLADDVLDRLEKKRTGGKSPVCAQEKPTEVKTIVPDKTASESLHPDEVNEAVRSEGISPTLRTYIPVASRRKAWNRSGGRCEYVASSGIRCSSRHRLEIDHLQPLAMGGSNESLRVLCKTHNIQQAQIHLGHAFMKKYVPSLN